MKNYIKNIYKLLPFFILLFTLTTGCRDDVEGPKANNDDLVEVTFQIEVPEGNSFDPARGINTRVATLVSERKYSNLYLAYVRVTDLNNNSQNEFDIIPLTGRETATDNRYNSYSIRLVPGWYRFYALANIDRYLEPDNSPATVLDKIHSESDIQNLKLYFTADHTLTPGNLPMIALPEDIEKGNTANVSGNQIRITNNNNNTMVCNLKMLCAKVRYTILFDATSGGISQAFEDDRIHFVVDQDNRPMAENVNENSDEGSWQNVTSSCIPNPNFENNWNIKNDWNIAIDYQKNNWDYSKDIILGEGVAEFYENPGFIIYRTVNVSPGTYRLEVQGFYRDGAAKDAWPKHPNSETIRSFLYIETAEQPLKCLYDHSYKIEYTGWGDWPFSTYEYPNDVGSSNTAFNTTGNYHNSVTYIKYNKGNVTFGIKNASLEKISGEWTCFDNFRLWYKPLNAAQPTGNLQYPLELNRFKWSASERPNYPESADAEDLEMWDGDLAEWNELSQKAWQGVVYLPENLSDNKTVLTFPFSIYTADGRILTGFEPKQIVLFDNTGDHSANDKPHGLERGKMYDIVARVKNPDYSILETDYTVSDWDKPSTGTDWDEEEFDFNLSTAE